MKRWLMFLIAVAAHYGGLDAVLRRWRGPTLSILMFHRVRDQADPLPLSIRIGSFDRIINLLARRDWLHSLDDGLRNLDTRQRHNAYALTFDDGYADNLEIIAGGRRIPALVYVATGLIEGKLMWPYRLIPAIQCSSVPVLDLADLGFGHYTLDGPAARRQAIDDLNVALKVLEPVVLERTVDTIVERCKAPPVEDRMLRWEEVAALAAAGIEIGGHTVDHTILTRIDHEQQRRQIEGCRDDLHRRLEHQPKHFCYPNGTRDDYDDDVAATVADAGFTSATTSVEGLNRSGADRFTLLRFNCYEERFRSPFGGFSDALFLSTTSGLLGWLSERRQA